MAIVILAVAGIGYFVFQRFINSATPSASEIVNSRPAIITDFGESILNDSRYLELRSFGQVLDPNANYNPGNPNPFQ